MTNGAAIGYMILAAKKLGLSPEKIDRLDQLMFEEMDITTEGEAEDAYRQN